MLAGKVLVQQVIQRDEVHLVIAFLGAPAGVAIAFGILRVPCKGKARPVTCEELVPAFEQVSGAEVSVEAVEKLLEDIIGELGALPVECGKRWCLGIETEILEQFMADGAAFHGNLEIEERIERDFPVTGEIDSGASVEILTVLIHLLDFGQQNLFDFFRVGQVCLLWSKAILSSDHRAALTTSKFHQ